MRKNFTMMDFRKQSDIIADKKSFQFIKLD